VTSSLDERIASLRAAQRAETERQTQRRDELADQLSALEDKARALDSLLEHLELAGQQVNRNVEDAAVKARRAYRMALIGLVVLATVGVTTIFIAFGVAAHIRQEARSAATEIRLQNAEQIAAARHDGEEGLEALQHELAERRKDIERQIAEIGTDLAELVRERDAVQSELERFTALQDRIGFDLIDYRGRTVIVVPAGHEVRGWRAPGLSDVARHNGQMFRVVEADD
jgi:DNA repair exonuclease SbcCD ATPase subunit